VTNFLVTIRVIDNVPQLKPGMSATVDITTDIHEDVLHVPIQCVVMREPKSPEDESEDNGADTAVAAEDESQGEEDETGKAEAEDEPEADDEADDEDEEDKEPVEVVFIVVEGEAKMKPVKTGIMGELDVEIGEGLEEGDMVVTGSYRVLSKTLRDGQKVKVEEKKKKSSR
jgi:HlyD family secretion protein